MLEKILNRRNLFLITMLIAILGPAFIIKSPISYVPFTFILLLLVLSYGYIIIIIKSFQINMNNALSVSFERLMENNYEIKIENKSILVMPRVSFSIYLKSDNGNIVSNYEYDFIMKPKEEKSFILKMNFPHVGRFNITISKIKFYGFIDLFFLYKKIKWNNDIIVLPKIYDIHNYEIKTINPLFSVDYNVPYKIKGGEFNDVREYVPGDSIKNIHWKLSAHSNSFITKIINTDAVSGVSVFMDFPSMNSDDYDYAADVYDCILESSYSVALYSLEREYAINFFFYESGNLAHRYIKNYDELAEFVCLFPSIDNNNSFEFLIEEYSASSMIFDNMIVLTDKASVQLAGQLSDLTMKGKFPQLFLIQPESTNNKFSDNIKEQLNKNGIEYSIINDAEGFALSLGGVK